MLGLKPADIVKIKVTSFCEFRTSQIREQRTLVLEKADLQKLLDKAVVRKKLIPAMLEKAQELGRSRMQALVEEATLIMAQQLGGEIERLEQLRELNDHVRPEEIALLQSQKDALAAAFAGARLRVDALRLILRTP